METRERFWPARLLWRLRGAAMWPAFGVLTLVDGLLLHLLPPVRLGFDADGLTVPMGIIIAAFGNLFLVGAVTPWLARRLLERERLEDDRAPAQVRLEALRDRTGTVLLALGVAGIVAAGLGSREVVVSETEATEENARVVRHVIQNSGDGELVRNIETANTMRLSDGYFRTCVARDDRRRFFCLLVDTTKDPTSVKRDPSTAANPPARR